MIWLIGTGITMALAVIALKLGKRGRFPVYLVIALAAAMLFFSLLVASTASGSERGIPVAFVIFSVAALLIIARGARFRKPVATRAGRERAEITATLSNARLLGTALVTLLGGVGGTALAALFLPVEAEARAVSALLAFPLLWAGLHGWTLAGQRHWQAIATSLILGVCGIGATAFTILQSGAI